MMQTIALVLLIALAGTSASPAPRSDEALQYYYFMHPPSMEYMLGDKRSNGMIDFGLARGMSGVDAAKARLGLKYANDPFGPGRR
ncbi:uncharacterized protein LOC100905651 [Galendromus occidentalis]|uniref:Uncharacterized protein LOC100905651 n=1 Tax=Galendromus occidentalis TaxID=34638 RepID=A0AAJ7L3H2_9ACAR|nr:uncharacterized protein LOC100905651 [Galendromus occidentalis]